MTLHRFHPFITPLVASLSLLVAGVSAGSTIDAQSLTRDTPLAAADLRADLAILEQIYTEMHPGIYRYSTPTAVAARFDAVEQYFRADRSLAEAFLALTRLTATIQCGHSYPNFWNQSKRVAGALFEDQDKLPFEFVWRERRMVILASHAADADLPKGTEVVSINGVATTTILDSLQPLARADGSNDAKRISYLEVVGRSRYHAFDVLYPLVFPVQSTSFALEIRRPGAAGIESLSVVAMSAAERRAQGDSAPPVAPSDPLWSYEESDGVGVMRMPTWAIFDSKWDARKWTKGVLQDISARGVPDLVIDLRGNEGGVDAGTELLSYLISEPVTLPAITRRVRYQRVADSLRPLLSTWDKQFYDWGRYAREAYDSSSFQLVQWDRDAVGGGEITPRSPNYNGRVWVLVGAANSSATFNFALTLKQSGRATLVGQPTGGNRRGINGSAFFFVKLPRTGLEVDLPLVASYPTSEQPDAGLVPDVLVERTVADIVAGVDAEMREVRRRIARVPR